MDMKTIMEMSEKRAKQADAIDHKVRNLIVDELQKIDGDDTERLTMGVLVAMGVAKAFLAGMLEIAEEETEAARPMTAAISYMADELLGPELVRLHKLAKGSGK